MRWPLQLPFTQLCCGREGILKFQVLCLQLPNGVAKARSRALTALVDGFGNCYKHLVGSLQRVCIVELAADGRRSVGHTTSYIQVRALCDYCSFDPRR
jgi:hypothetical protein